MDMVKEACGIIERFEDITRPAFDALAESLSEEMFCVSGAINTSCSLTTKSALRLLSDGMPWDAIILLRTVINATAKFCYLLSSDDAVERNKRLEEFVAGATIKEYGSTYPHICGMLKQGLFGSGDKKDFVTREILNPVSVNKLNENTPREIKDFASMAQNHLKYLDMSHVLANEFEFWESIATVLDFEYAAANSYVHVNYIASGEIMHWLGLPRVTQSAKTIASTAHILFMFCVLQKARSEMIFKRAGIDPNAMRCIMTVDSPFVKMVDQLDLAESNRITNATDSQGIAN